MGRVLVIIGKSEVKRKIISHASKLKGSDFFFLQGMHDFADDFQCFQPDALIVGQPELTKIVNNPALRTLVKSVKTIILVNHELNETAYFQELNPIVLNSDFNLEEFKQLIGPDVKFSIELLDQCKPLKWIFDNLPMGMFWKDLNLRYLGCNKYFSDDQGIQHPDLVVGLTDYDLFQKSAADEFVRKDQELIKSNESSFCYEEKVVEKDGSSELIWKRKILIRDDNQVVVGILGIYEKITQKRNQENELWKERHYMQLLMDNIPDTIYFKDIESRFTRINKAQAIVLGLQNPTDAVGKSDADFFDESHSTAAYGDEQEMMRSGHAILNKLEHIQTATGHRYVTATKIPLMDDRGEVIGMVGVSRDVTKSHELEMRLQQETNLLNALMNNVPDSVYFKDRKSQFVRVSNSWLKTNSQEEAASVIGKTDADFFSPEFAHEAFSDEQRLMQTGDPLINKLESRTDSNGKQVFKLANKVAVFDQNCQVVGMIGISHDITALKMAEFKLAREKELLQSLMDNIPDTIYFKDTESRFIRVNRAFAAVLELQSPDEAIGKTDFDFFQNEQATLSYTDELEILKSGSPLINRIEKAKNSAGKDIWLSSTKIPLKDLSGEITGIVGISRDVTEVEEARKNLIFAKNKAEEANKAKSMFLANMSHEIRTPMNGVIGMADVLNQTMLTEEQHEYLNIITKSGNNLLCIINNILDFSKIESGSLELEKAPINIRQIIENVADILILTATNKGVNLVNYVDSAIPEYVEGDAVRLHQILLNLVNNALKFTERGEVYFTAELIGSSDSGYHIIFKVKDNGIGISDEAKDKIFQSFSQVDSSTTRKYGGTGLGLAISKRLVEMMGGTIGVESTEGEGSLFWFSARFDLTTEIKPSIPASRLLINGLKVLIVDDNRTNRFVFGKYLETWNCKYEQAEEGETALQMLMDQALKNNAYDLALIDYQMDKMDGLKLAEKIRQNQLISTTRLILLSSVTDIIPRSEVSRRGFNYFLNKPVKLKDLYSVISSVTGNSNEEKSKPAIQINGKPANLRVLVAEDNPTNLKVAELILKPFIALFESAENGLLAFEKFKSTRFDIIFMDVQMPVMNGYEATVKIRDYEKENNLSPVKIVAMTANAMKEDVELCLSYGMDKYLSKPFKRDDMIRIIENLNLT